MKRYLIIALVLLAALVGPVMATITDSSHSTESPDPIIRGGYYILPNPADICAEYGLTAFYADRLQKQFLPTGGNPLAGGDWIRDASTPAVFYYPGNVSIVTSTTFNEGYPFFTFAAYCNPSGLVYSDTYYHYYNSSEYLPHYRNVNYTCNIEDPVWPYKNPPFNLECSDSSSAYPAINRVNWTLYYPNGAEYSSSSDPLTQTLVETGWYGLDFEACNDDGCGYVNTSQLINITSYPISETGISFWVHTYDPITGAKIGPSDIGIGNTTSGGWRNSSTNLGTANFDSTDYARLEKLTVGQNVNLCGEAPGYQETCTNVSIAYDGWEYILNLVRTDLVPAGNQSTMIVNVINSNTAQTISGVSLTISNSSVPYSSSKLSDSNGIATFSNVPAAGSYQIAASKTGYVSATKFWPVYPGQVSNAYIGMLPVGVTPVTTGPGGDPIYITPTTTTTYAPGETPDTRTDAEKDEDMMNLLRDQGPMLIQFFIVCFVVYMVMGMAGKGGR